MGFISLVRAMSSLAVETFPTNEAAFSRLSRIELDEPTLAVLNQGDGTLLGGSMVEASRALVSRGLLEAAVSVLAQALSRQATAWWACRAARLEAGGGPSPNEVSAVEAAEEWVMAPTQARAYAAQEAAERVGLDSPAGCAALAAFCVRMRFAFRIAAFAFPHVGVSNRCVSSSVFGLLSVRFALRLGLRVGRSSWASAFGVSACVSVAFLRFVRNGCALPKCVSNRCVLRLRLRLGGVTPSVARVSSFAGGDGLWRISETGTPRLHFQ
jgi:hypothetical protein